MVWIGSKNPNPFNRQFIYLARGVNVKCPGASYSFDAWRISIIRRGSQGVQHSWEAEHYLTGIRNLEKNPPCNAEDNLRAGLVVIEAWFRGY